MLTFVLLLVLALIAYLVGLVWIGIRNMPEPRRRRAAGPPPPMVRELQLARASKRARRERVSA